MKPKPIPHASILDLPNWNYPRTAQAMANSPAHHAWAWVSLGDRGLCLDEKNHLWVAREAMLTLQQLPSSRAILASDGEERLAVWVPFTSYDFLFKCEWAMPEAYLPIGRVMPARPAWTY